MNKKCQFIRSRFIAILTMLFLITSTACSLSWPIPQPPSSLEPEGGPAQVKTIQQAEISFVVKVPADTPSEDTIYISILDEVTGLALNAQNYPMQPADTLEDGSLTYSIQLPFTMGSAVFYRYERQTPVTTVAEHIADGRPVRYRIYHVEGPGGVEDVVSRWTDTPFNSATGRIMGKAIDATNQQPVPNLLITAGGAQTFTSADGSFLIESLPAGIHNLVAFAQDGSYHTYQQGAEVAADSTTPTSLSLQPASPIQVTFTVKIPDDTPPLIPVRLAGSLYQLGNTFANLTGGVSSLAANMPVLEFLSDGRYSLTLTLPEGADIRYKYTLGDGYWNAEHDSSGNFRLRQLVVSSQTTQVEDVVDTWQDSEQPPVTFDVTAPPDTPVDDTVSIQLSPFYGWTEPIPMWRLEQNRWAYIVYSPLSLMSELSYRYCRNGQCGIADDVETAGADHPGRLITLSGDAPVSVDQITSWAWFGLSTQAASNNQVQNVSQRPGFVAGIEFLPRYHPSWRSLLPNIFSPLQSLHPNWLVLPPTWTFSRNSPPILEPVAGQDASWFDLLDIVQISRANNIDVAIYPTPHFNQPESEWWESAPRDYSWWLVWFNQYQTFIHHYTDLAARSNASALILGGDWVTPALPGGLLANGQPSSVPLDSETRWRNLIAEIRSRYNGKVLWAISQEHLNQAPPFLDAVDGIYLLWSKGLTNQPELPITEIAAEAGRQLDSEIYPLYTQTGKPIYLGAAYPSIRGALSGCLSGNGEGCLSQDLLSTPGAALPSQDLALPEQAAAYESLLQAVNARQWIAGFISRDYYPPAVLQDKSNSINGKPASDILRSWFGYWLGKTQP